MKYLVFLTAMLFTSPKIFAACEEFLGTIECVENDVAFDHTLDKITNGYVLLAKSGSKVKELVFNGEKFTTYTGTRKSVVSGKGKCTENKLTLVANAEETSLDDPTNVMRSKLEINYEKTEDNQIHFTYEATSVFTESNQSVDFHRAGKGNCSRVN